ncbi:4237_t:CDS:2 [Paraglomus brasilianum]|uniref:4237_t:CDS:1 n=1 Tax=Paraglomus brasilianum TaxID=144538 RepID=A0A9N9C9V9_9GLOM|nr:4237_t:CDS:2 [Paraglomus brasilianum]
MSQFFEPSVHSSVSDQSDVFIQQTIQTTMVELSLSPESHRPNRNFNNKSNRAVAKKHLRVPDFTGRYHLMRVEKPGSSIKKTSAAAKRNKTVGGVNEPVQLLADESFNKNNNNSKGNNKIGKEELACMTTEQLNNYARFIDMKLRNTYRSR